MLCSGLSTSLNVLDANLGERATGTLDGEDPRRDADGDVGGDGEVELLEDLQHLWICECVSKVMVRKELLRSVCCLETDGGCACARLEDEMTECTADTSG